MPRIRILSTLMPPILSEIVHALVAADPGFELLEPGCRTLEEVHTTVTRMQPDVVMMVNDKGRGAAEAFLFAHPRVRLVTLSADARSASLHALYPRRVVMHDVSPQALLGAIRGAVT